MWLCYVISPFNPPRRCALINYFRAPLDYFDPSVGVAKIALARFNATSGNRRGSVFVNPGGPGGSGASLVAGAGEGLQGAVRFSSEAKK